MENSTKALLIAGTVLVVLVLIGLGMKLFNSSASLSDDVAINTESTAASNFNAQFTPYINQSASATDARSLVQKVLTNNAKNSSGSSFSANNHQVYINLYNNDPLKHCWKSRRLAKCI